MFTTILSFRRIDDIAYFMLANLEVMRLKLAFSNDHLTDTSKITLLADELDKSNVEAFTRRIAQTSNIHKSVVFKDLSCQISNSVIGRSCNIGANVKLQNCVVMNNVTIGDSCTLINCLLCSNCLIGDEKVLKDARIGYGAREGELQGDPEKSDECPSKPVRKSSVVFQ